MKTFTKNFGLSLFIHLLFISCLAVWASSRKTDFAMGKPAAATFSVSLQKELGTGRPQKTIIKKTSVHSETLGQPTVTNIETFGNLPHPTYPETSRKNGEEGEAWIGLNLDEAGKCLGYWLEKTSGYQRLDQASLDALESRCPRIGAVKISQKHRPYKVVAFRFRLEDFENKTQQ